LETARVDDLGKRGDGFIRWINYIDDTLGNNREAIAETTQYCQKQDISYWLPEFHGRCSLLL
jgi:hypothetical protein